MPGDLRALIGRLSRWRERVLLPFLGRRPVRPAARQTDSGLTLPDLFTPADIRDVDPLDDIGFPGEPPYTRGVYPSMYRGRLWTMRQYAGFGTAETSNARYTYLLSQGQTGLSVAFDLPTQIGYDPDHPMAAGEVGRVGVSIASLADMETLMDGIPLSEVSTSMTINATAPVLLALYVATAKRQGVEPRELRGTLQNDILKEYIARGTYIFPPEPSLRLVSDVFEYTSREMPRWNPVSVSGYHIREAGATAVQEVAFTLANGLAYVEAAVERGLDPDDFMPRLSFFFAAQSNLIEEVAKFRAARRLWQRLTTERFAPQNPRSTMLRFHTQTAGVTLTAQQPVNNVVRVTVQALAGVLGGTQSLHTNAMDEALGLPTEHAATVALRTQQILAHESGVADIVDPLAGSYAVEALTARIEAEARDLIETLDGMGGALPAIASGFVAGEIADSAYRLQAAIESNDKIVVGVNAHTDDTSSTAEVMRIEPELEARRAGDLAALKEGRDAARAQAALDRLRVAAEGDANLMPLLIDAVEAESTLGEICDTLRDVWGEYQPPGAI